MHSRVREWTSQCETLSRPCSIHEHEGARLPQTGVTLSRVPRRRWRIAFLLAFGVMVAFFDRINLSVSQDALHASFGLSLIAFGYLSSAFSWTYALTQMP